MLVDHSAKRSVMSARTLAGGNSRSARKVSNIATSIRSQRRQSSSSSTTTMTSSFSLSLPASSVSVAKLPSTIIRHASTSSSSPSSSSLLQPSSFPFSSASSAPATSRHSSSSSPTNAASSSSSGTSAASALTWNQFLQLRKTRRRYNLMASVSTGVGMAFTGAGYLSTVDLNQLSGILFGIDPFMALGVSTIACGALGWLIGPLAGSALFNMTHRSSGREMLAKEKDFFHRIAKYRADITAGGNLQNTPFPDYYGEKIDSVAAYRQWLRDQRKFSKKREYREK